MEATAEEPRKEIAAEIKRQLKQKYNHKGFQIVAENNSFSIRKNCSDGNCTQRTSTPTTITTTTTQESNTLDKIFILVNGVKEKVDEALKSFG